MHPLMAAYALGATILLACLRIVPARIWMWAAALALSSVAMAACIQISASPESADYRRVALTRSYWFPAAWSWYELAGLAAPLAILAIFAWRNYANMSAALLQMQRPRWRRWPL